MHKEPWLQQICIPQVVYEDEWLIAVNKPSGMPSVPAKNPVYPHNAWQLLSRDYQPIFVVHRLDINTSGIMLYARTQASQSALSKLFQKREIKKSYHALVHGHVSFQHATVDMPIITDWPNRPLQKIDWLSGKLAQTTIERVSYRGRYTHLKLSPMTGRSHQLRIHCAMLGHPIVGCQLYHRRMSDNYGLFSKMEEKTQQRLMLHAQSIAFYHPFTKEWIAIDVPSQFERSSTYKP